MDNNDILKTIEEFGLFTGEEGKKSRDSFLIENGFPIDQKADYVILSSCLQPSLIPNVFISFKKLLEYYNVNYTFLSKEYCCGYMPLVQPAILSKDKEELNKAENLSKRYLERNLENTINLFAKYIVVFCSGCYIMYTYYKNSTSVGDMIQKDQNIKIVSYIDLIDRIFSKGRLEMNADFYAGCYRANKIVTSDNAEDFVKKSLNILERIEGLKLNFLDNRLCCAKSNDSKNLIGSMKTPNLINICTGCYNNTMPLAINNGYNVFMLPDIVLKSLI